MAIILYKPLVSNSNIDEILNYLVNELGFTACTAKNIINAELAVIKKIEERNNRRCNYGI